MMTHLALDSSVNRHGGQADMESNADEAARERAEAVEERGLAILWAHEGICPECGPQSVPTGCEFMSEADEGRYHLATCELLRARAESEVDAAERAK